MSDKFGVLYGDCLIVGNSKTGVLKIREGVSRHRAEQIAENGLFALALAKSQNALEKYLTQKSIPKGVISESRKVLKEAEVSCESALADLLQWITSGDHYETRNPYSVPQVQNAMQALGTWDTEIGVPLRGRKSDVQRESVNEATGDLVGMFIRDLERDMREIVDADPSLGQDATTIAALARLVMRTENDTGVKRAMSKIKKSGTWNRLGKW